MQGAPPSWDRASVEAWLYEEASLLDGGRYDAWLKLLADGFRYQVWAPVEAPSSTAQTRLTTLVASESLGSLRLWVRSPAIRRTLGRGTRHFVTNLRMDAGGPEQVTVYTNILLTLSDLDGVHLLAGTRTDTLATGEEGVRLVTRDVNLDAPVLDLPHLRVVL